MVLACGRGPQPDAGWVRCAGSVPPALPPAHAPPLQLYISNVVVASLTGAALLAYLSSFLRRVHRSRRSGKHWSHRRQRLARLAAAELVVALAGSVTFLIPNVS